MVSLAIGVTKCYLSPDASEHTRLTPARQAGTQLWLRLEMVYVSTVTHPSSNRAHCRATLLIETNAQQLCCAKLPPCWYGQSVTTQSNCLHLYD